jgi:diketogulonate reductase-like aldo/keto reductase
VGSSRELTRILRPEYIDLFLMHTPLCGKELRISTWRFLNEIMEEEGKSGIIRAIGVSNL